MISEYAVELQNLKTGRVTVEAPVTSIVATETLNAPSSLAFGMALDADAVTKTMIEPRRNGAFVRRDGVLVPGGDGFINVYSGDVATNTLTVRCIGWHEYVRNMMLKVTATYVSQDQTTGIAKNLIDYCTNKSGALPITTANVVASGVLRDRTWGWWERLSVGKLIEQLAAVDGGFNFRYRSNRGAEGYSTEFLTSYPASGRQTNHVFEMGANVDLLSFDVDGSAVVNSAEAIGAGSTTDTIIVPALDVDTLGVTPLWETSERFADVREATTLGQKARRMLTIGRDPVEIPKLRLSTDGDPQLGTYLCGDRVRVRGSYGVLDIDDDFVITQTELNVTPEAEYIDVTVAPVLAFTS